MATQTMTAAPPAGPRDVAERAVRTVAPLVDIYEGEKTFVLLADMPGVSAGGLEVVAERDTLVIRGHVDRPTTAPDYQEFELADYYRAFTLTEDLDTGETTATLRDGVLRIEIPKSPRVQPKKIAVHTE